MCCSRDHQGYCDGMMENEMELSRPSCNLGHRKAVVIVIFDLCSDPGNGGLYWLIRESVRARKCKFRD